MAQHSPSSILQINSNMESYARYTIAKLFNISPTQLVPRGIELFIANSQVVQIQPTRYNFKVE